MLPQKKTTTYWCRKTGSVVVQEDWFDRLSPFLAAGFRFVWSSIVWLVFILLRSFGYRGLGFYRFWGFRSFKPKDFIIYIFFVFVFVSFLRLILMIETLLVYDIIIHYLACVYFFFTFFSGLMHPPPRPCDSRDRFSGRYTMICTISATSTA